MMTSSHVWNAVALAAAFWAFGTAAGHAQGVRPSNLLFENFRSVCLDTGARTADVVRVTSDQGWSRLSGPQVRALVGDIPGSSAWTSPPEGPARTLIQAEALVRGKTTVTCVVATQTPSLAAGVERSFSAYVGFDSVEFSSGPIVRQRNWTFAKRDGRFVSAAELLRERPDALESASEPIYIVTFSTAGGQPFLSLMARYP